MHIETKALVTGLLFMAVFPISFFSTAQDADTVETRPFERYWTKQRLVAKIGLGLQNTAFVEAGIQLHQIYIHPLSLASAGPYVTVDGMIAGEELIIGPKVGYEVTAGLIGVAADATYYTDFKRSAFVFTPRAGISIMGFVNLFYGRNIGLSDFQFEQVDQNRFSLVFNLNRDYFNLKQAPKRQPR